MASALAEDIKSIEDWMQGCITLRPFGLPEGYRTSGNLQWSYREVLRTAEEFRILAISKLSVEWMEGLPVVPLTKVEVKGLLKEQFEKGEKAAFGMLKHLDSTSSTIITELGITRETVRAVLIELKERREAQTNLLSIICGTRFKYYFHGVLVPTRCPNQHWGRQCGKEDSLEHMIKCYSMSTIPREGPELITFLTTLAKRSVMRYPAHPSPMYIIPARKRDRSEKGERGVRTQE